MQYFDLSYKNALDYANNSISEGRKIAIIAKNWAYKYPWHGKNCIRNKAVFLACTDIAYDCGKIEFAGASRRLGELANYSHTAASNAMKDLIDQKLIKLVRPSVGGSASVFRLGDKFTLPHRVRDMGKCKDEIPQHDVFHYFGLSNTSRHILNALIDSHKSIEELAELTGISKETIENRLDQMAYIIDLSTGEKLSLVKKEDEKWILDDADNLEKLDNVAWILGVSGKMRERKKKHKEQQRTHDKELRLLKKYKKPGNNTPPICGK